MMLRPSITVKGICRVSRRFCNMQGRDNAGRRISLLPWGTVLSCLYTKFWPVPFIPDYLFFFFAFARSFCIRSLSTISEPRFSISFSYSRIVCRICSILSSCCRSKTLSRSSINGTSPCQIARIYRNFRSFSLYRSLALHCHTNPVAESPNRSASQTHPFTSRLSIL